MRIYAVFAALVVVLALEHAFTTPELKVVDSVREGDIVRYAYVGEEVPEHLEEGEVKEKRTESSYSVYLGTDEQGRDMYRIRTYAAPTFVRDGLAWHTVEYGEDTQEAFLAKTRSSIASRIARAFVPPTYAVTVYSHSGDGHIAAFTEDWFDTRNSADGVVNDQTDCSPSPCLYVGAFDESPPYGVARGFLPFNTSSIPSGATISAASLNVYITFVANDDNDGNDFLSIVQSSQVNYTALATTDFNNVGSTEGVDVGQRKDMTGMSTSAYLSFALNATGLGWIAKSGQSSACHSSTTGITCLGVRSGNDLLDHPPAPVSYNFIGFYPSERTGTSQDPYLDITYSEAGGGGSATALSRPPNNLGLVGYWSLDDGTGTVATDFSGFGNSGVLNGGTWINGKRGKALQFNGTSDRVGVPTFNTTFTSMTVLAWVDVSGATLDSCHGAVYSRGTNVTGFDIGGCGDATRLGYTWNDDSNTYGWTGGPVIPTDGWFLAAMVVSPTQATLYAVSPQGTQSGTHTYAHASTVIDDLEIGRNDFDVRFLEGSLDDVRIYNRTLGQSEIEAIARAGAAQIGASSVDLARGSSLEQGLVGHWTFDGTDTLSTITDRSGQGNHGYFRGGATSTAKTIGVLGQGLNLDGINDTVYLGSPASLDNLSIITIAAWVKPPANSNGGVIFAKVSDGCCNAVGPDFWFNADESGTDYSLWYAQDFNGSAGTWASDTPLTRGQWQHIAVTYNRQNTANDPIFYLNGVALGSSEESTPSGTALNDASEEAAIGVYGASADPVHYLDGPIDDVRIYNRILTPAEVKQLYNLGQVQITE